MFYKTYSCISGLILVLQILHGAYSDTKVPVGTIQIPYTEVPVGTFGLILIFPIRMYPDVLLRYYGTYSDIAELILVLRILYLYYGAYSCISDTEVPEGTIEHFTYTKVPIGTTEHIQRYP